MHVSCQTAMDHDVIKQVNPSRIHTTQLRFFGGKIFRLISLVAVICTLLGAGAFAQDRYELAVESDFLRQLDPPGIGNGLLRPESICVDRRAGEVFVSDPGNNRIVVFDTAGVYLFEFGGKDVFRNVGEVVIDSRGFIYVLGSAPEGRFIYKFDYDGLLLGKLEVRGLPEGLDFAPLSLNISEEDLIYVVNGPDPQMIVIDTNGEFKSGFAVLGDLTEKLRRESVIGQPEIDADRIYLPVPSLGSVFVYHLDGSLEREIGIRGNLVGQLNFPSDVTIIDHRIVAVIDKHRFVVVTFTTNGQFLGEFGGMGVSPGKFYHPAYIDHDDQQRLYISQRFMNRVQVCNLPQLITERLDSFETHPNDITTGESAGESSQESLQSSLQPRLPENHLEEVVLKTSSTPVSVRSFLFVSKSRRLI